MEKEDEQAAVHLLGTVPIFAPLKPKDLTALVRLGVDKSYKAGDRIVTEGDKGIGFYLVLSGQVEIRKGTKALAKLAPGGFFGEMALFDELPRTADAVALVPTRCLVLSRWEFWSKISDEPEVLRALMAEVVRRLRANPQALSD